MLHVRQTMERCGVCQGATRPPETHLCDTQPCFPGVVCADNGVEFRCGPCPPGFAGDGVRCERHPTCNDNPCYSGISGIDQNRTSHSNKIERAKDSDRSCRRHTPERHKYSRRLLFFLQASGAMTMLTEHTDAVHALEVTLAMVIIVLK